MQMKAKKALIYNGRRYQVGQEFEVVSRQDARTLAAIRKAEFVPAPGGAAAAPAPAIEAPRLKRKYTRRDLTAEDASGAPAKTPDELPSSE